jgi:oligogalacturonide lyase
VVKDSSICEMFETYASEKQILRDPDTGHQITQWTNSSAIDQPLYFTTPSVTLDKRSLVFISERTGKPNLFRIDRQTGEIQRISDADGLLQSYVYPNGSSKGLSKVSPFLDSIRGILYWIQDDCVYSSSLNGNDSPNLIARLPAGWITGYTALSSDGARFCVPCTDPRAFSPTDRTQHEQLNRVPMRMLRRGLCTRLYVIDLNTGKSGIHAELPFWCTHVQFHPGDSTSVLCNSEGPKGSGGKRGFPYWGRMWAVDGKGQYRRVFEQGLGETANHENWIPDGSGIIFHGKVRPVGIRRIINLGLRIATRVGLDASQRLEMAIVNYVAARTWEGAQLWRTQVNSPVSHAVALGARSFVYDNRLGHITYCTLDKIGCLECRILCSHKSSMSNQDSHPHPSPVPGGKSIVFGSDAGGSVNVYEVDLLS